MIDSHCHIDFKDFDADRPEVIARAREAGVRGFVCIGAGHDLNPAKACVRLASSHADIVATVGIHPHDAVGLDEATWTELDQLARHPRVVAIGETGLDYHYDYSPREVQRAVFRRFIALAAAHLKPVICHIREAHDDALAILREEAPRAGVIIHSFSGGVAEARRYLDLGYDLSFSGILTFKNATELREAAAFAPVDRVLVETDAPYLAPIPMRGKRNEPAFLPHTLRVLAEVRGADVELLDAATETNTRRVLGLGRPGLSVDGPAKEVPY